MSHVVSFPGLGWEFHFSSVAFSIGSKPVYWYGIVIVVGVLLAVLYASVRAPQFDLTADNIQDMILIVLPVSIICARLYYVAFQWDMYRDNPAEIIAIWHGGLAIYGGLLGGMITIWIFCRVKKLRVMDMLDVTANAVVIGQACGRWGNFFNCEAYGGRTGVPWRMVIDKPLSEIAAQELGNHPTFFYESAWNVLGLLVLHFFSKKRKYRGEVFLLYLIWYGFGRFWIEGLRTDSLYLWGTGIRVSQAVALISVLVGAAALIYNRIKPFLTPVKQDKTIQEETET